MPVVTRYAPSPTGALHIGGARTALFCWAYARHHDGQFLLRFEDTDRERSTLESETVVLEALRWLGIDWDAVPGFEDVPRQSERGPRYEEVLAKLLESGAAYRCVCDDARLEHLRERARQGGQAAVYDGACRERGIAADCAEPFCVRLRIDAHAPTRWDDAIAGASGQDASDLGDYVVARTDGTPIYHLACSVDDHDMGVTHVIRGREHMSSTSRQLPLYSAMGWQPPAFAHVPLLVEASGKKLSKRQDAVSVQSYRERGFSPQAVLNFIARLGWGHGDLELFDREQLAEVFEMSGVGHSASQVHEDKLLWISQHWIKTLPMDELVEQLQPFLDAEAGRPVEDSAELRKLLDLLRERSKTWVEMAAQAGFWLRDEIELDPKAARKQLKAGIAGPLGELRAALADLTEWTEETLDPTFHAVAEKHDLKLGKLAQPVRVAIVGVPQSPGIFETLAVLGKQRSLQRIGAALEYIAARDSEGGD
ncbi:MAG: glutamate--tRNA ligase [Deltaproteobacteria bacterium]|nr:glutamate--tRNA ligase [Deltaproteobacteria bacterium]MBW2414241.1 glutamate--tRNA ligase [Deltaproteobacteria bacterium]